MKGQTVTSSGTPHKLTPGYTPQAENLPLLGEVSLDPWDPSTMLWASYLARSPRPALRLLFSPGSFEFTRNQRSMWRPWILQSQSDSRDFQRQPPFPPNDFKKTSSLRVWQCVCVCMWHVWNSSLEDISVSEDDCLKSWGSARRQYSDSLAGRSVLVQCG